MKIAIISDQHGELPQIPDCDLLIVSGDMCGGPSSIDGRWRPDLSDDYWWQWLHGPFVDWCNKIPYTIVVAGNHDTAIWLKGPPIWPKNIQYLHDSSCEYAGLKFYGMPWVCKWDDLAFGLYSHEMQRKCSIIPLCDILVCHGPPNGYGDRVLCGELTGSIWLTQAIDRIKPKLVTCGHIHEARGIYTLDNTTIINSARSFIIYDKCPNISV